MHPPRAPKQLHVHQAHQDSREDSYHWLKDRDNPEVLAHLKNENAYTEAMMAPLKSLQETIYQETLARIQETDQDAPWPYQHYEYYFRTVQGQEHEIFCRRLRGSTVEEILFDENIHAKDCEYFEVGTYELSPDGRWLALTVDQVGDEIYNLWLIDLKTMVLTQDQVTDISSALVFSTLTSTLWYCIMDETHRPFQVVSHHVNSDVPDLVIFQEDDERYWVGISRTDSDAYLMVSCSSKLTSEIHYTPANQPNAHLTCFLKREHEHEYDIDHHGDYFYIHSNKHAKNFGLWRCPLAPTPPDAWEVVIPHEINTCIEGFSSFKDFIVVSERRDGLTQLKVYPDQGEAYTLPMPETVYSVGMSTNWEYDTNEFRYAYHSLTTPPGVYLHDTQTRQSTLIKQEPVLGDYRPEDYEAKRLYATALDGTRIPISLVYKKSLHQATMPLYMNGYGAYGIESDPWFSYSRISLLNRGFVFAIAHIRGGSDLGEPWHDAGKLMNKKNSFSDFIACSRYLIDQKITAPDRFFINGGSAGGLLMGAVLNDAPELYRGAVVHVPFVDVLSTMLDESLPLTVHEYEEWGNPQEKAAYDYIKSYSPYDNVRTQAYPALFITGGLHDPRVSYWEPAKWVAKLRDHQTADNPILLKIQMSAGHGGLSGRYEALKEVAEEFGFILGVYEDKLRG
jgi:oligopeptidase B